LKRIKNNNKRKTIAIFTSAIIILAVSLVAPLQAQEPIKVAIIPFEMNAEKDLSFLRDGIVDMLASRLTWDDKVMVFSEEQTASALEAAQDFKGESQALLVAGKLGADYVLFGSLTVFGDSVSIDSKMVNVTGNDDPFVFFTQTQGMGMVIPKINQFATDINAQVFGRGVTTAIRAPAEQAPAVVPVPVPQQQPPAYDQRAHPDKLAQEAMGDTQATDAPKQAETPKAAAIVPVQAGVAQSGTQIIPNEFWKSGNFKVLLNGLAIGDVDGDGRMEIVTITPDTVLIHRFENQRLIQVSKIETSSFNNFVGVDVADINGNGMAEIFVSGLNAQRNQANSFVFEFDGQAYKPLVENGRYFFRVVDTPDQGPILCGQHIRKAGDPWGNSIDVMAWQAGNYEPRDKILSSDRANVLGIAIGDARNNGQETVVSLDKFDRFRLFDPPGTQFWRSDDKFGGSTLYYVGPQIDRDAENRQFLPTRILILDLDKNGKNEVLVANNSGPTGRAFTLFRQYTKGSFAVLEWDGLGLFSKEQTRKISGFVRDFAVADFDGDGQKELVAAIVQSEGRVATTSPKSSIIAYELK